MSKKMIKDFLSKFTEAEKCDSKESEACNIANNSLKRIDSMDLRRNTNKEKVFNSLFALKETKDDCDNCSISDGVQIDLAEKWSRNKLNLKPKTCNNNNQF